MELTSYRPAPGKFPGLLFDPFMFLGIMRDAAHNDHTERSFLLKKALTASMEMNTTMPKPMISPRSDAEGLLIPKESRTDGIWISTATSKISQTMAMRSHLCGGVVKTLYFMDRKLRAMMISVMMNRKNISVRACAISARSWKNRK